MFNAHNPPCHFVKFCRPEHNILNGCQTIRFGTLEYYRQLDPSSVLADSMEGRETTDIRIADSQNASPEVKEMFPLLKNRNVTIQNSKAGIQSPNCWVWCCSIIQKDFPNDSLKEFGKKLNKNYTSFYAIPNPTQFEKRLMHILNKSISSGLIPSITMRETSELIIGCCSRHVVYEDKKLKIEKGQLTSYCEDLPPFLRRIFVKPKKFAWQCEYRFALWIQEKNTNKVLAFLKDPIGLPILPIADIQPLNLS